MNDALLLTDLDLLARFPEGVTKDERKGYEGYLVAPEKLLEVAAALRDELGYDFLSSLTGVDYLPEGKMEVVYHLYRSTGGSALVLKAQTPREGAALPSLTGIFPGAEFQEREAWDLLGIRFEGHPDLRRILMWEGFAGHPLRKDWKEAFYEEEVKPFKNRWPEGNVYRIEDNNPYHNNIAFPPGFDPDRWTPDEAETLLYSGLAKVTRPDGDLETDTVIVNLGPQHPSTHGVFRMVASLDGETITDLKPVMGYLHRNHEKIGERNTWLGNIPFTDRLDYLSPMSNNFGYVLAVEKLMAVKPPERAEYIRVIMAELTRICNHLMAIGALINDLGVYFTGMLYALEERELILDVFEAVTGARMMNNYFRFGGLARDMDDASLKKVKELMDRLPARLDDIDIYITHSDIIRERCEGQGVLTQADAIASSAAGPVLRASGVPYDVRRADPYSIYERFDFDVAVRYHGDIYDRYLVRMDEMRESVRIVQQALRAIPQGPIITGKPTYTVRVPAGEAYGRVEAPKGELGFYVVSNGKANPWRYHVRAPSFINLTPLAKMCRGNKIADVVAILGSIDIVLGETDR
jgi:NADH-quinone oxidoreductase subunit D/NADH-quinone oxidoreductase subunit C/D